MVDSSEHYYYAIGKRKTSVAKVRLYMDNGPIIVNGKPVEEAFPWDTWLQLIHQPFEVTESRNQFRVVAKVNGGGVVSQAGALRHGIARALQTADPNLRAPLKKAGLLTRDAREKESKKYGLARARKAKQWTKR
ncbi:MAG: 30S ribosomal protein S9 [SAR202 cluster bacterium]|jgi:small subunit ribosomal protein S9|nr:30S ribosomal protein S9 [Chloroflexota bacterium]MDP6420724.1 30S ribosomal protein S9 [SAR202 cluster bacterium]MDP6663759.1 30S ribosomal protein S9 [SAR202 cluster bacterium]MDP6798570.1 30S ribosomal protein S9 [SAR202 cluster bacterium]MQG56957.1 30S ribosomal protein S9 [SAR202 cluster bacterium]|tara:strand:+ start:1852 stop:2253 length:402 start_codon:yes stop_codon:yes gene_type:complete